MSCKLVVITLLLAMVFPTAGQDTDALALHPAQTGTSGNAAATLARPVARVNGAVLTQGDLLREMYAIFPYAKEHKEGFPVAIEADIRRGALKMIEFEELVYQEAKRRSMTIMPERLAQAQKQVRKQFPTEQQYRQFLQLENDNSEKLLRRKIERSLLIDDLLKVEVTEKAWVSIEEARTYYDKTVDHFRLVESYNLQTITIMPPVRPTREHPNPPPPTPDQLKQMKARAEDALRQAKAAKNYEEFGMLAEKISEDDYRVMMGDHKTVAATDLPSAVLEAVSKLQPGQITDLVQAEGAYSIIRLNGHTPARTQSFREISKSLRVQLREQKTDRLRRELDAKLRKSAKIEEL